MKNIYDEQYKGDEYYWGLQPSDLCYKVMRAMPPVKPLKLLDIGCGEGKDALFFARNGYDVTAFDLAGAGVEKTKRLADRFGVPIKVFKADLREFRLEEKFDILYSNGVLHYVPEELRPEISNNYKECTAENGIHMFAVFVQKPFIAPPPENEEAARRWISGEIFSHYHDWKIEICEEEIFDCMSSGIPHKHAMNRVLARKM